MTSTLKNLAIQKALENNWEEACQLNLQILAETPDDIDTLNRLGFSYIKSGLIKKAKDTYKKVLELDRTNPIALKNLKKIDSMPKTAFTNQAAIKHPTIRLDELFIEEAGKTKIVELRNITDKSTLSLLQSGDKVQLVIKRYKIFVQTEQKKYIGMLPDNIGTRLIPFMKGSNEYEAFIKSIDDKSVTIFVKETFRAKKFKYQPSFAITTTPLMTKEQIEREED